MGCNNYKTNSQYVQRPAARITRRDKLSPERHETGMNKGGDEVADHSALARLDASSVADTVHSVCFNWDRLIGTISKKDCSKSVCLYVCL